MWIEWLNKDRPIIDLKIDEIFCKHESNYTNYRNNYKNQLLDLMMNPSSDFNINRERNKRLVKLLIDKGELYPIAVFEYFDNYSGKGFMCTDGHHRIMAYLTAGFDSLPALVYKDADEAGQAKANASYTDYYKDLMEIDKEVHGSKNT